MMFELNIVAVFDGISAGRVGINKTLANNRHIRLGQYMRSEIDKFANQVAQHHFPEDIQLGDVTKWREWDIDWSNIDIFIGGSPCQGFSFAGKQAGTKCIYEGVEFLITDRHLYTTYKKLGAEFLSQSHLFWEYVLILDHVKKHNPNVRFLLENVKMKKELLAMIDDALGVESIVINSNLLSAQNRHRHYWNNWSVSQPADKGVLLRDVLELHISDFINPEAVGRFLQSNGKSKGFCADTEKSKCLTASSYKGYGNDGTSIVTKLRPCERIKGGSIGHIVNATDIKGMDCIKRIYGQDGKAPTLTTMGGGHREPKVGIFQKPRGKNLGGLHEQKSPTLTANSFEQNHLVIGGAIRGRYDGNGKVVQQLEINGVEKTNCLTTVQKDNVAVYRPAVIVGRRLNDKGVREDYNLNVPLTQCLQVKHDHSKMGCLTIVEKDSLLSTMSPGRYVDPYNRDDLLYRKLTPIECERLQTFPDNYTAMVSNSQRYKSLGNSWTVDVISHIFDEMILDMELSGYFSERAKVA